MNIKNLVKVFSIVCETLLEENQILPLSNGQFLLLFYNDIDAFQADEESWLTTVQDMVDPIKAYLYPQMEEVESSRIQEIGYVLGKQELYIIFSDDSVYLYSGVSENIYEDFLESDSKGKFFQENIKDRYQYEKIDFLIMKLKNLKKEIWDKFNKM